MLYISLDKNQLKLLHSKKTLLSQHEVKFFEKSFEIDLIEKGAVTNTDILASAVKEALTVLNITGDKEVFLILPQESFSFLRADVPADIALSAIRSFIYDKAHSTLSIDVENYFCDYYVRENENQKHISFFALEYSTLEKYQEVFNLLNLKLVSVLPEALALFKLFEKTLRNDKKENILYLSYTKNNISGYLFDSAGLLSPDKWSVNISKNSVEKLVKEQVEKLKAQGTKLNRIILSGPESEKVRQDTFTKEVGAWTNPLKRIIPTFYEEYLKQLILPSKETLPILVYDACFGAFVFSAENKEFQMLKKSLKKLRTQSSSLPKFSITKKDIFIFLSSLIISFGILMAYFNFSRLKSFAVNNSFLAKKIEPSPAPTTAPPSPTPVPTIEKDKLRIKVLNGSGTKGKATTFKELLKNKGYQEILTDNADSFDYKQTVIQAKKSSESAISAIKNDIKESVASPKTEELSEKDAADIVIIIGSDFK